MWPNTMYIFVQITEKFVFGLNLVVNVYICYITLSQIFQVLYNYETIKVHPDTLPDS